MNKTVILSLLIVASLLSCINATANVCAQPWKAFKFDESVTPPVWLEYTVWQANHQNDKRFLTPVDIAPSVKGDHNSKGDCGGCGDDNDNLAGYCNYNFLNTDSNHFHPDFQNDCYCNYGPLGKGFTDLYNDNDGSGSDTQIVTVDGPSPDTLQAEIDALVTQNTAQQAQINDLKQALLDIMNILKNYMLEECQEERDDKNALATLLATLPNTLLGSAAPDRR